jgi:2'-5' RNA ligase
MTKSYVAYFPNLDKENWISEFRAQHDQKSHLVAPHMTLVFPTDLVSKEELRSEVQRIAAITGKFKVRFRCAIMMPEKSGADVLSSVFLVPDEGFGEVVRLHDGLYGGRLKDGLRLDIPFIPHITMGSGVTLTAAKAQVDSLNSRKLDLEFLVDRLTVVEIVDEAKTRVLDSVVELK